MTKSPSPGQHQFPLESGAVLAWKKAQNTLKKNQTSLNKNQANPHLSPPNTKYVWFPKNLLSRSKSRSQKKNLTITNTILIIVKYLNLNHTKIPIILQQDDSLITKGIQLLSTI